MQVEQIAYMQSNWVDVSIGTFIFLWRYFNTVALIAFNSMYSFFLVGVHNWNSARLKAAAMIISYTSKAEMLMRSRNQSIFLCLAWLCLTYFWYSKAKWYQSRGRISDNNLQETWVRVDSTGICKIMSDWEGEMDWVFRFPRAGSFKLG